MKRAILVVVTILAVSFGNAAGRWGCRTEIVNYSNSMCYAEGIPWRGENLEVTLGVTWKPPQELRPYVGLGAFWGGWWGFIEAGIGRVLISFGGGW